MFYYLCWLWVEFLNIYLAVAGLGFLVESKFGGLPIIPTYIFDLQSQFLFQTKNSIGALFRGIAYLAIIIMMHPEYTYGSIHAFLALVIVAKMERRVFAIPLGYVCGYCLMNEAVLYTVIIQTIIASHEPTDQKIEVFYLKFVLGAVFFIIFAKGTRTYDYYMRHPDIADEVIPNRYRPASLFSYKPLLNKGFLFRYVTTPNMLCRMLQWCSFYVMTGSSVALHHALMVICFCVARALTDHRTYSRAIRQNQKAIIPFIL